MANNYNSSLAQPIERLPLTVFETLMTRDSEGSVIDAGVGYYVDIAISSGTKYNLSGFMFGASGGTSSVLPNDATSLFYISKQLRSKIKLYNDDGTEITSPANSNAYVLVDHFNFQAYSGSEFNGDRIGGGNDRGNILGIVYSYDSNSKARFKIVRGVEKIYLWMYGTDSAESESAWETKWINNTAVNRSTGGYRDNPDIIVTPSRKAFRGTIEDFGVFTNGVNYSDGSQQNQQIFFYMNDFVNFTQFFNMRTNERMSGNNDDFIYDLITTTTTETYTEYEEHTVGSENIVNFTYHTNELEDVPAYTQEYYEDIEDMETYTEYSNVEEYVEKMPQFSIEFTNDGPKAYFEEEYTETVIDHYLAAPINGYTVPEIIDYTDPELVGHADEEQTVVDYDTLKNNLPTSIQYKDTIDMFNSLRDSNSRVAILTKYLDDWKFPVVTEIENNTNFRLPTSEYSQIVVSRTNTSISNQQTLNFYLEDGYEKPVLITSDIYNNDNVSPTLSNNCVSGFYSFLYDTWAVCKAFSGIKTGDYEIFVDTPSSELKWYDDNGNIISKVSGKYRVGIVKDNTNYFTANYNPSLGYRVGGGGVHGTVACYIDTDSNPWGGMFLYVMKACNSILVWCNPEEGTYISKMPSTTPDLQVTSDTSLASVRFFDYGYFACNEGNACGTTAYKGIQITTWPNNTWQFTEHSDDFLYETKTIEGGTITEIYPHIIIDDNNDIFVEPQPIYNEAQPTYGNEVPVYKQVIRRRKRELPLTVLAYNERCLYHQIDNYLPQSDMDMYIGSVYIRQNTSLHSTVVIDSRTRGGGILESITDKIRNELEPESDYYLDIGYYDGKPYQENGVVIVRLDKRILKEYGGLFSQGDVETKINTWIAAGIYPIIEYVDSYNKSQLPQYTLETENTYTNIENITPEILLECVNI